MDIVIEWPLGHENVENDFFFLRSFLLFISTFNQIMMSSVSIRVEKYEIMLLFISYIQSQYTIYAHAS